jgi:hypothetical protein
MALWTILVMGVLRWYRYWDIDRLLEMVNNHQTIRQMLGHVNFEYVYKLQTIKDNVSLLTPEILVKNQPNRGQCGSSAFQKKR